MDSKDKPSRLRLDSLGFKRHRPTDSGGSGCSGTTSSSAGPLTPNDDQSGGNKFWRAWRDKDVGKHDLKLGPSIEPAAPPNALSAHLAEDPSNTRFPAHNSDSQPFPSNHSISRPFPNEHANDDSAQTLAALRAQLRTLRTERDDLRARLDAALADNAGLLRHYATEVKDAVAEKHVQRRRANALEDEVGRLRRELERMGR